MNGGDSTYCIFCGKSIPEDGFFCPYCGKACRPEAAQAEAGGAPSGKLNFSYLVKGIISLLSFIVPGVIALIFTFRAAKAKDAAEEKHCLKIAKIANFVGKLLLYVILAVVIVVLFYNVILSLKDLLEGLGYEFYAFPTLHEIQEAP